ncbi:hypothetical protein [Streptomyces sp. NPDC005181]|uniref:hypothetical protein n=1 Tax=Streptomyces sp. NPDC005181 TaxID=3156869 RepID=UPI0033BD5569
MAVAEPAELTGASEMTIRRDLDLHAVVTDESAPLDETDALAAAGVTVRKV